MPTDFIPSNDDSFDTFLTSMDVYVHTNGVAMGVAASLVTDLSLTTSAWATAFAAWNAVKSDYEAKLAAKDTARATAEAAVRAVNNSAQASPTVTDAHLSGAGLPIHKTTRTPAADVETHPVLTRVDQEHLLQRLWYADSATPSSRARPPAAAMCEIREAIVPPGGPAPTDPEKMTLLAMETRAPHRTDFEAPQAGHTAYYALRWVGRNAQPGPWSLITGHLVT